MRVQLASITLVLASVAALMAETVEGVAEEYSSTWHALEWVFLVGFGVEYLAYLHVATDRWRHVRSSWGIVDLLATLPSLFLVLGIRLAGGFLRILRSLTSSGRSRSSASPSFATGRATRNRATSGTRSGSTFRFTAWQSSLP
jgi:hypothetical protein